MGASRPRPSLRPGGAAHWSIPASVAAAQRATIGARLCTRRPGSARHQGRSASAPTGHVLLPKRRPPQGSSWRQASPFRGRRTSRVRAAGAAADRPLRAPPRPCGSSLCVEAVAQASDGVETSNAPPSCPGVAGRPQVSTAGIEPPEPAPRTLQAPVRSGGFRSRGAVARSCLLRCGNQQRARGRRRLCDSLCSKQQRGCSAPQGCRPDHACGAWCRAWAASGASALRRPQLP
jgi:hypothetical protein